MESKDEIEFVTNWKRPFEKLYKDIKWLNLFTQVNDVFSLMVFNEFKSNFFVEEDNIFNK